MAKDIGSGGNTSSTTRTFPPITTCIMRWYCFAELTWRDCRVADGAGSLNTACTVSLTRVIVVAAAEVPPAVSTGEPWDTYSVLKNVVNREASGAACGSAIPTFCCVTVNAPTGAEYFL